MLLWPAFVCVAAAYIPGDIKRVLKHPMLVGIKLWAFGHLLANEAYTGIAKALRWKRDPKKGSLGCVGWLLPSEPHHGSKMTTAKTTPQAWGSSAGIAVFRKRRPLGTLPRVALQFSKRDLPCA